MYRIIGADRREYGPIPAEQVQQWIGEGRINSDTLIRKESEREWKPLYMFSEFVSASPSFAPPLIEERKSRLVAGLLGILLGGLGVHRFYLGYTGIGLLQLFVTIVSCGWGWVWGFVEGILILTKTSITTDADGVPLKE